MEILPKAALPKHVAGVKDKIIQKLRSMRGASDGVQIREIIDVSDGSCTEYRKSFQSRQKVPGTISVKDSIGNLVQ